jgi:hypothetical protein
VYLSTHENGGCATFALGACCSTSSQRKCRGAQARTTVSDNKDIAAPTTSSRVLEQYGTWYHTPSLHPRRHGIGHKKEDTARLLGQLADEMR